MTCTVAAVISFLGVMPAKGTVIIVPRSSLDQYTAVQVAKAKLCAARYGIHYRIDEDR